MAFLVPNAQDALTFFDVLDQSEPDAVDFEILGNNGSNYVVTGCGVTTNSSSANVIVASGVVVVQGKVYSLTGSTFSIPAAPVNKRFDLVIARLSGSTVSLVGVKGPDSSTNPTYPVSRSITTVTFDGTIMYDPATDVVLAALYRPASGTVSAQRIMDKRTFAKTLVSVQSASTPTATPGTTQAGVLNYKTGTPTGSSSGLFVGDQNGSWTELAANANGPYVPIGVPLPWPCRAAVPTNYLEANGQLVSTTTYAALFALYSYDHGGAGGSFGIPNFEGGYVPKGTTQTAASQTDTPGQTTGADTVSIAVGNLPSHAHDLQGHSHTFAHTHGIDHDHANADTAFAAAEQQDAQPLGYFFVIQGGAGTGSLAFSLIAGNRDIRSDQFATISGGSHKHAFDAPLYSGSTTSQSTSTTSGPSSNSTSSVGSGTALSTVQKSMYTRWIVRAL